MASDLLDLLVRANLALAAGVILVLVLRLPVRRVFGARVAYSLWILPLAAAAMCFAPARVEHIVIDAAMAGLSAQPSAPQPPYLLWAWIVGASLSLVILLLRQARFTLALGRLRARDDLGARVHAAESSAHGPAVVGVLRPIIITPADFDARFDADERRFVLAHEQTHLAHGDHWINALVVFLQCVNWFNPFMHIGARILRIDQELACDAAVITGAEGLRRRYAEAILKTHVAAAAPIGCAWPPSNLNALKERIVMLKHTLPSRTQMLIGASVVVLTAAGVAAASWAAQPARIVASVAATPANEAVAPATLTLASAGDDALAGEDDDRRVRVIRNGEVIEARDLTPEEREEIRRSVREAREAMDEAREAMAGARLEQLESLRSLESLGALESLSDLEVDIDREAIERAVAEARAAADDERLTADERREVAEAVREAMREVEVELAAMRSELRNNAVARDALREARIEVVRELDSARARGDIDEISALEQAEQALRAAEDRTAAQ